ncbi:MAG TPA: hypothetical protein VHM26_10145, partial [Chitinophagaceae bacterium]|nr:hypothetical protein [Chitinophagaceae bacterium]
EDAYAKFQHRYEMFVGGYLYFYDERTRSGVIDTILYFKWSPYQKSYGEYSVVIYIWPAPLKKKSARVLSKSSRLVVAANGNSKKANGGVQVLSASAKTTEAMDGGDGDTGDLAIDPPPPPPPPPPPYQ